LALGDIPGHQSFSPCDDGAMPSRVNFCPAGHRSVIVPLTRKSLPKVDDQTQSIVTVPHAWISTAMLVSVSSCRPEY